MAVTLNSFNITETDWVDVSVLTGIVEGSGLLIQNQSSSQFYIAISSIKPVESFRGIIVPANLSAMTRINAGETKVWIKGSGRINIQEA